MRKLGLAASALLLGVFLVAGPSAAQDDGNRIHLIQGIPDTDIDVEIDGELAVEGFAFRDTQDLSGLSGQTLAEVKVKVAGTDDVVVEGGDIELPPSGNATVVVHLKVDGTPSISIFENDISQLEAGQSRLVVRHLAAAPAVDVLAAGEVVFESLANGEEVSADLPAGDVIASLVPAGESGPVVIGPADLPLLEGVSLIVYGLGSIERDTMTVVTETIEGLDGTPTAVNTGNSPVDPALPPIWGYAALVGSVVVFSATVAASWRPRRAAS